MTKLEKAPTMGEQLSFPEAMALAIINAFNSVHIDYLIGSNDLYDSNESIDSNDSFSFGSEHGMFYENIYVLIRFKIVHCFSINYFCRSDLARGSDLKYCLRSICNFFLFDFQRNENHY